MFTVLSQNELRVVNDSLDYGGKAFYKTLYMITKIMGNGKINKRKYMYVFFVVVVVVSINIYLHHYVVFTNILLLMCQLD